MSAAANRWFDDACKLKEVGDFCALRNDWRGAYRSYGSSVEYMLKALYLRNTQQRSMPSHMRTAASHDLNFVAQQAGLGQALGNLKGAQLFNWLTVRDWDQGRRYPNQAFPVKEGKDFRLALLQPELGIWQWLLNEWHRT
ncbi:hypothetical protein [Novosphingobium indicum]|uniref:hypothetical protein n=1 Tax=Novosphingobium indicum TaxID=462949 RepID=UPI0016670556|nr:hypothetical protein [Novosphingobium indicum]